MIRKKDKLNGREEEQMNGEEKDREYEIEGKGSKI